MSSKQINLFISPEEKAEISELLLSNNCLIIRNDTRNTKGIFLNSIDSKEALFQVYLSKPEYISKLYHNYLESNQSNYVDISYIIEFDLGGFYPYSNKELNRGRLYYVFRYYQEDGDLVEKDSEFIKWADELIKEFKKYFFKRAPDLTGDFISDPSLAWAKANHAKRIEGGLKLAIT